MSGYGGAPKLRLSTQQVAERLGVKPETVYAYVSRGLLHSVREQGGRGSWFDPDAVEALAVRSRQAQYQGEQGQPGFHGLSAGGAAAQPVIATSLTQMQGGRLYYRGLDVSQLAQSESFESVAGLLWNGGLGETPVFKAAQPTVELVRTVCAALPSSAKLPDLLRIVPPVVSATDPLRFDTRPGPVVSAAASLLAVMVESLPSIGEGSAADHGMVHAAGLAQKQDKGRGKAVAEHAGATASSEMDGAASIAERLWPKLTRRPATAEGVKALNAALIVMADHDLAVSTMAGRVAASARAHPYAVVSAALGAFDGPLHGAAGSHAYRLLTDALASGDPVAAYADRLRTQGWVEGFGHRSYPEGDPRAIVLLDLLAQADIPPEVRAAADGLVETARRQGPDWPNVDFALPLLAHAYGMVPDAGEVIFILGRTVGWIAHALEEYEEPALRFRFQGTYRGVAPVG
jgi:citrate synthase